MISGYNNLSTFSGYLAMGRPHRQLVLILTEVVPPLTTLFLHLRFIIDYAEYVVLQTDSYKQNRY